MIISIEPLDVLFFRDSKPFARGSEHFANSIFPPYPQTLYGALRTKVLEELNCDFEKFKDNKIEFKNKELINKLNITEEAIREEIGTAKSLGTFKLQGPLLLLKNESIYVSVPLDVKKLGSDCKILTSFNWSEFCIESDLKFCYYPHIPADTILDDVVGYISLRDLIDFYLLNTTNNCQVKTFNEIFDYEQRVGIALNSQTNTAEEGKLYTINYVRLKDGWSFYAKIENLSALPKKGTIKFGGANRVCYYEELEEDPLRIYWREKIDEILKEKINKTKKFKLVFLTPTIFKNGWLPECITLKEEDYILKLDSIEAKLLTAAVGKPKFISGWDIANRRPKPLRKLVPSGSVYYFELISGDIDDLFNKFNFKNFSDENTNLGFGLTIIGGL